MTKEEWKKEYQKLMGELAEALKTKDDYTIFKLRLKSMAMWRDRPKA